MTILLAFTSLLIVGVSHAQSPVAQAARDSNWKQVELLVNDGFDVNSSFADGSTALHWASYRDNLEVANLLIDAGAHVDSITDLGVTPLWLAAENGSVGMTELLLDAGANPNSTLSSGESILMTASLSGDETVVELLLLAGAEPNVRATRGQTALMWAAGRGHGEVVKTLLEHGADPDARTEVRTLSMKTDKEQYSHPDYRGLFKHGGNNALMFAARSGDYDSAAHLIESGSDVNQTSASGVSPLIMAVHNGNEKLVELLASNGADINQQDAGYSALHAAVLRRNHAALKVLLAYGADGNAKVLRATPIRRQSLDFQFHETHVGATPLWLAARFSEPEMMTALLEHGADPYYLHHVRYPAGGDLVPFSIVDEGQVSVLMAAIGMGNRRLDRVSPMGRDERNFLDKASIESLVRRSVQIAIDAGVDPNLKDASNRSALDAASGLGYGSVIEMLSNVLNSQKNGGEL